MAVSCSSDTSLQKFIVEKQEREDIISFDLSSKMLSLKDTAHSIENAEILNTIKKANIIAYKIDTLNRDVYNNDKEQLTNILKNKKYSELMRTGKGSNVVRVYTIGNEEALDEVIVYLNDKTKGWALVRVIGDDMQPDKIMQLIDDVKLNDPKQLEMIANIFKEKK
jgi:hypothetical protein